MRVLIVEYLHAQSEAFRLASDSMRREGRAMLDSFVEDARSIDGVKTTTALCSGAAEVALKNDSVIEVRDGPEFDFAEDLLAACEDFHFDRVFIIAPESGGILSQVVRRVRHSGMDVSAPSLQAIALCADKLATHQFLQRLRIPCIPTHPLNELARLDLDSINQLVVKSRDGAGCETIVRLHASDLQTQLIRIGKVEADSHQEMPQYLSSPLDYLVQPFIAGDSYSVGLVGRGLGRKPLVLPVATQTIEWSDGTPSYRGGSIPTADALHEGSQLQEIAAAIAEALKIEHGYVGIDFLCCQDTADVLVTEINPRLCTSYVGYRQATSGNLAEFLLDTRTQTPITWDQTPVKFDVQG